MKPTVKKLRAIAEKLKQGQHTLSKSEAQMLDKAMRAASATKSGLGELLTAQREKQ